MNRGVGQCGTHLLKAMILLQSKGDHAVIVRHSYFFQIMSDHVRGCQIGTRLGKPPLRLDPPPHEASVPFDRA